ncbi:MAG: hypothetical protein HYX54_06070 [Chloroflexi bacterium]|nr:hypothetical protein [Chloroflexota bacterium]
MNSEVRGSIERVWHVEATYAPDGAEARMPFRAEHIARLQRLKAEGTVIEAGAFTDVSSTVMIIRALTEDEVWALARDDVYLRNGIWVEIRVRPFGRVRDQADD